MGVGIYLEEELAYCLFFYPPFDDENLVSDSRRSCFYVSSKFACNVHISSALAV